MKQKQRKKIFNGKFLKYVVVSGVCFALDFILFKLFSEIISSPTLGATIFIAAFLARLFSSMVNYYLNRNKIFMAGNKRVFDKNSIINYYALVVVQLVISVIFTTLIAHYSPLDALFVKILVDVILFIINFVIQDKIIFKDNKKNVIKIIFFAIKSNIGIFVVLVIYIVAHLCAAHQLGFQYNLKSDDLSYLNAGIDFAETGKVSMHGVISAQIMPMMNFIIGFTSLFFSGDSLWVAIKILWLFFWIIAILVLYSIIKMYTKKTPAVIACALMLSPEFIWMNNVILTETPFVLGFLTTLFYSLKLERSKRTKDLVLVVLAYLFSTLLKANFAIYPLILFVYLLFKRYDFMLLLKQGLIAAGIVMVFFIPWTIRNYNLFHEFIPLTYGGGNPMLLGTYQGVDFPDKSPEQYLSYIKENSSGEMLKFLNGENLPNYKKTFYSLKTDGAIAKNAYWIGGKKTAHL